MFTKEILDDLNEIFVSVCHDFEAALVGFDGEDDHVHRLVYYPPKVSVSALVNSQKGVSNRVVRKMKYPAFRKTVGRVALVPQILCRKLWRSSCRCDFPIHRTAENTTLTLKFRDGLAVWAILPRPEGRALPGDWINQVRVPTRI